MFFIKFTLEVDFNSPIHKDININKYGGVTVSKIWSKRCLNTIKLSFDNTFFKC